MNEPATHPQLRIEQDGRLSRITFKHNVMPTMVMSALSDHVNRNAILWLAY